MSKTDAEKKAEKLKEAARLMNGQHDRTINLLVETVVRLCEEVAELKAASIRKVYRAQNAPD